MKAGRERTITLSIHLLNGGRENGHACNIGIVRASIFGARLSTGPHNGSTNCTYIRECERVYARMHRCIHGNGRIELRYSRFVATHGFASRKYLPFSSERHGSSSLGGVSASQADTSRLTSAADLRQERGESARHADGRHSIRRRPRDERLTKIECVCEANSNVRKAACALRIPRMHVARLLCELTEWFVDKASRVRAEGLWPPIEVVMSAAHRKTRNILFSNCACLRKDHAHLLYRFSVESHSFFATSIHLCALAHPSQSFALPVKHTA